MNELKPCPFCGEEAELDRVARPYRVTYHAGCGECGVYFTRSENDIRGAETRAAAIAAWNRRPDAPRAGDWESIETAPKDGTRILVWRADVKPGVPYCDVTAWPTGWVGLWPTAYMHYADGHEPTHWRPLPAPPQADGAQG